MIGLKTPFRDGLLRHVAEDVLKLAKDGLERRSYKEARFLREVAEFVTVKLGEFKLGELLDSPPPGLAEAIAISKI
ncbi:uncharacterized protein A4U43_C03F14170 [Asparagus officinalis]|uniref:Uncharacterized protein n=1 Tax=Asparagus officinalis TaxID=4686 RepID=A0A5P1FCR8_ASPOF|nr:uncharacterized protein A4U43_C03F14170 [Asparagus officinalis]